MADKIWTGAVDGDANVAGNWTGGVPGAGDRQIFDYRATRDLDTNLGALSAVTGSIVIDHSFTKNIGAGGTTYYQTAVTAIDIGQLSNGSTAGGSSRIQIDNGAAAVTYQIRRTGAQALNADGNLQPLRIKGSNLTLNVSGASKLGVAQLTGETATVANLRVLANDDGTPSVELGRGVTVTAQTINAGEVHSISDNTTTTTTIDGGVYDYEGTGAHGTVTVYPDSTFRYSGSGNITTLVEVRGGTFDASRYGGSRTIATARFYKDSTVDLDNGVNTSFTFTNPIEYPDGLGALASYKTPPSVKGTLVNI